VQESSRGVLDLGVALMSQNPQVTIDIQGHTDSDGPHTDNLILSQERVDAIFDYLVAAGVDPGRLTREAFGESRPIADNSTAEGRASNRRVEFTINNLLG
jgi:OmpA-OmpF porin, OOP family